MSNPKPFFQQAKLPLMQLLTKHTLLGLNIQNQVRSPGLATDFSFALDHN